MRLSVGHLPILKSDACMPTGLHDSDVGEEEEGPEIDRPSGDAGCTYISFAVKS